METEIEAKFLDINPTELRRKLLDIGAKLEHAEILMKRKVFDYPDNRMYKIGGWVRVRDEGDKITLCYKQLNDRTLHGTKEINIVVNSFDATCHLLETIGLESKSYQETKREKWLLGDTEITIDTWPWIPTFVEVESVSEKSLKNTVAQLNLNWPEALHGSVETAYQKCYDVTEEEVDEWKLITFTPVPDWLEKKRK